MSLTKNYMMEVQERSCTVCEDELTDDTAVCDICGNKAHDDCASSYTGSPSEDAGLVGDREVWCGNCENRFHHAVSKDP